MSDLQKDVDDKAAAVRELKANKADAEVIKAAVAQLLEAKERLAKSVDTVRNVTKGGAYDGLRPSFAGV